MTEALQIQTKPNGLFLSLRVRPSAKQARVAGVHDGALRVFVKAAPEKGRANEAVKRTLAAWLGIPKTDIEVVAGLTAPRKRVRVAAASAELARRRLGQMSLIPESETGAAVQ